MKYFAAILIVFSFLGLSAEELRSEAIKEDICTSLYFSDLHPFIEINEESCHKLANFEVTEIEYSEFDGKGYVSRMDIAFSYQRKAISVDASAEAVRVLKIKNNKVSMSWEVELSVGKVETAQTYGKLIAGYTDQVFEEDDYEHPLFESLGQGEFWTEQVPEELLSVALKKGPQALDDDYAFTFDKERLDPEHSCTRIPEKGIEAGFYEIDSLYNFDEELVDILKKANKSGEILTMYSFAVDGDDYEESCAYAGIRIIFTDGYVLVLNADWTT